MTLAQRTTRTAVVLTTARQLDPFLEAGVQALLEAGKQCTLPAEEGRAPQALVRADASLWQRTSRIPVSPERGLALIDGTYAEPTQALLEIELSYGFLIDAGFQANNAPRRAHLQRAMAARQREFAAWARSLRELDDFTAAELDRAGGDVPGLLAAVESATNAAARAVNAGGAAAEIRGARGNPSLAEFIARVRGTFWDHWATAVHPEVLHLEFQIIRLVLQGTRALSVTESDGEEGGVLAWAYDAKVRYWMRRALPAGRTPLARAAAVYFIDGHNR